MKLNHFYFIISLPAIALSCDDSDEIGGNEKTISVSSFDAVPAGFPSSLMNLCLNYRLCLDSASGLLTQMN